MGKNHFCSTLIILQGSNKDSTIIMERKKRYLAAKEFKEVSFTSNYILAPVERQELQSVGFGLLFISSTVSTSLWSTQNTTTPLPTNSRCSGGIYFVKSPHVFFFIL